MARILLTLCCCLCLLISPRLLAQSDGLFQVAVPVKSQSGAERAKAASLGLRKVLIRMAGSPSAVDSSTIRQAYSQAQNFIEQFHYEPYSPKPGAEEHPEATELLVMTFSRQVVERLLREAGEPYWPPNRPKVFVWLVEDSAAEGRRLVNSREAPVVQGLIQGARDRGLEIRLPLLDLEDQLAMPAERLWQLDSEAVREASERYNVDTILVGRYTETSRGEWLSTWQFLHRGANREYDLRADSAVDLGQRAIDPLADYLAGLYSVSPQEQGEARLVVQVADIETFGDYRTALDYLAGLAVVNDVELSAVRGDTVLLYVQADGGLNGLQNALALDRLLRRAQGEQANSETPPWLRPREGTLEHPAAYIWHGR